MSGEPSVPHQAGRQRSHWAWGYDDELPAEVELRSIASLMSELLGFDVPSRIELPVSLNQVALPDPGVRPPEALAAICSTSAADRARHAHGQSYEDLVKAFRGRFDAVPDVVAYPAGDADVGALIDWCQSSGLALIPYGGGTSVSGGVTPLVGGGYAGVVSVDLSRMNRVLEVDGISGAALIEAGATGPEINRQLAGFGWTLRHFPQSWEFSTLGGWIATRAGGHYATGPTRIDDFVESIRAITPRGPWESRRLPGSGAGISPDRLLLGSEGSLGVITRSWIRVQRPPAYRATVTVRLPSFAAGADAVRAIVSSGLRPAACRLLDPTEARLTAGGDGGAALLVLGFESADHPVRVSLDAALELARAAGGRWGEIRVQEPAKPAAARAAAARAAAASGPGDRPPGGAWPGPDASGAQWRSAFLRMPYLRNAYPALGLIAETVETAVTWDRFPALHEAVVGATSEAAASICGAVVVTTRLAFAYPDGVAPYYTVLAPGRPGEEAAQWAVIKRAASEVILAAGGTITHHHAVGRVHRPWYDEQRPEPFALALLGAKAALDPRGVLNPGVLVGRDPAPADRPSTRPG
ncbi:MAG: FAD-binding oxidoreductase [Actinomycetota bacterium]|nr:FAD-binding oxidoreductase [Actinomycetota bacterium]